MHRVSTTTGRLARMGFQDAERSTEALRRLGDAADELVHLVAAAADPDQAAAFLGDLADRVEDRDALLSALVEDEGRRCGCCPCWARARRWATTCCGTPSTGAT